MDLFRYYGVDWLIFMLLIWHMWLLGDQKRSAFVVGGVAAIAGITFGCLVGSLAQVGMNLMFVVMYLRAYSKWKGKDD